jgi:VWFA-related protein
MNNSSQPSRRNFIFSLVSAVLLPAFLVLLWPSTTNINAQQQPIQVRSTLVQVDALVTDANGNKIENLNLNNFQLSEDRHPQKLTAVDFYDIRKFPVSQETKPIDLSLTDSSDSEIREAVGRDHRLIVLFFDLTSYAPKSLGPNGSTLFLSVTSAKKFVNEQTTPADLVAIITFGTQLSFAADFTNDRPTLSRALDSLTLTVNDRMNAAPDTSFYVAQELSETLARFPGRKSVVHFTGGLRSADPAAMEKATDAANKNNVTFYEIDGRGLVTGMGANSPNFNGSRSGMDRLAHDTGGALFTDLNDFTPFFKQILDESTGYYLLSYESSNRQHDGLFRSISIKVVGIPGAQIKYRPGYFAPKY